MHGRLCKVCKTRRHFQLKFSYAAIHVRETVSTFPRGIELKFSRGDWIRIVFRSFNCKLFTVWHHTNFVSRNEGNKCFAFASICCQLPSRFTCLMRRTLPTWTPRKLSTAINERNTPVDSDTDCCSLGQTLSFHNKLFFPTRDMFTPSLLLHKHRNYARSATKAVAWKRIENSPLHIFAVWVRILKINLPTETRKYIFYAAIARGGGEKEKVSREPEFSSDIHF